MKNECPLDNNCANFKALSDQEEKLRLLYQAISDQGEIIKGQLDTIADLRQALTGRTVSCCSCEESAKVIAGLRKEVGFHMDVAHDLGRDKLDIREDFQKEAKENMSLQKQLASRDALVEKLIGAMKCVDWGNPIRDLDSLLLGFAISPRDLRIIQEALSSPDLTRLIAEREAERRCLDLTRSHLSSGCIEQSPDRQLSEAFDELDRIREKK